MNRLQKHDKALIDDCEHLIGVDEAGRGCLAGPVVAGACVLSAALFESTDAIGLSAAINDSKQLKAADREKQFAILGQLQAQGLIDFAVAEGSVVEIAELNILGATRLAMQRALEALAKRSSDWSLLTQYEADPLFAMGQVDSGDPNSNMRRTPEGRRPYPVKVVVDGRPLKPFPYTHEGIVKGDGKSLAIAMASIAAKVARDRAMVALAKKYPAYGFAQHKGYGTAVHRMALKTEGPCEAHRELFLRKVL